MWAHSANGYGNRHTIADHLGETARLASQFAEPFGASDAARWLGLWHDLGKLHPAWQAYLLQAEATGVRGGPDHKLAGTLLAARHLELGAFALQGHHGGLRSRSGTERVHRRRAIDAAGAGSACACPLGARRHRTAGDDSAARMGPTAARGRILRPDAVLRAR
ncbi:MAG: CRISPR-associated endonuclease Cas3'' [Thermoflexaceae bacterium]|nr:CRISPR-associated endonuclease Cas3'' [Thermoflexaceae bacterium]